MTSSSDSHEGKVIVLGELPNPISLGTQGGRGSRDARKYQHGQTLLQPPQDSARHQILDIILKYLSLKLSILPHDTKYIFFEACEQHWIGQVLFHVTSEIDSEGCIKKQLLFLGTQQRNKEEEKWVRED